MNLKKWMNKHTDRQNAHTDIQADTHTDACIDLFLAHTETVGMMSIYLLLINTDPSLQTPSLQACHLYENQMAGKGEE